MASQWMAALPAALLSVVFERILRWHIPEEHLAETIVGKMMILHLHPINAFSLIGFVLVAYGVWLHSDIYTMTGVSLVLIGHFCGAA